MPLLLNEDRKHEDRNCEGRKYEDQLRRCSWAALVFIAVCSLVVSVATRYCFGPSELSTATVKVAQKQVSPQVKRQHMTKNAADWVPPVISSAMLQAPSYYPRFAPAAPPIPNLLFEEGLHNRPPPFAESLS
jgi:hypothetical protein